jgi:5-methylcytosine-specific restriction endonuclease McrA
MPDERISVQQKELIAERARYRCEYCFSQVAYCPDPFSVDHITPRSMSGTNNLDNLAFACLGCNNRKFTSTTALDPVTGTSVPLYHPRRDI